MVWMDIVRAGPTAWRVVGPVRDGAVDRMARPWTTRPGRELSPDAPRVVHGSGLVHPRARKRLSTELSPDVGELCAHGDAGRPIDDGAVVTSTPSNRWTYPAAVQVTRCVTVMGPTWITGSVGGAASVVGDTMSGRVSRVLWKIVSWARTVAAPVDKSDGAAPPPSRGFRPGGGHDRAPATRTSGLARRTRGRGSRRYAGRAALSAGRAA